MVLKLRLNDEKCQLRNDGKVCITTDNLEGTRVIYERRHPLGVSVSL